MGIDYKNNPELHEFLLRSQSLVFRVSITANATPASKIQVVDIPSAVYLRSQGLTAAADAIETLSWTTAVDNSTGNSVFGILIDLGENEARKVELVRVTEITSLATSFTTRGPGAVVDGYLTASGNIAIEIAGTGLNLASESPTFVVEVVYQEAV